MTYKKILKLLSIFLFLWFCIHIIYTIIDGNKDEGKSADIAVILGTTVNTDGTLSERLEKRMKCGLKLYKDRRIKKIIVSGGLGKEGFLEGDKMKEYLIGKGIPDSLVIVDNKGNNTTASVANTILMKDSLHYNSIIVVSQYFHVTRTKMLFRKEGFENVSSVSPDYSEYRDFYSLFREFFAYYYDRLK
ncbi:MAG: hypothetical protein BGO88_05285 [Flavobacterium sp. 38-13]|uniref:YdcF family protein n=1 Tax=Flavobacterium sp. 38-13 TaxID=1896168 RepID=UPI0009692CDE|nr:YdcF family protein [Flavobacterium sp. 38-13]OJX53455.1 MAG: hypothetical protein BGO88_05285 [Flavobacterium sp. 38-13]